MYVLTLPSPSSCRIRVDVRSYSSAERVLAITWLGAGGRETLLGRSGVRGFLLYKALYKDRFGMFDFFLLSFLSSGSISPFLEEWVM